jgi:glutamate racemase
MSNSSRLKVVFTDSGLGGISILANFVKRINQYKVPCDVIFFNAQYSRDLGYKKMDTKTQNHIFNRVLETINEKYQPDIIAIACNTLSVVYYRTDFYKNDKNSVVDIIDTGKLLIESSKSDTIINIAMPTTIESKIYTDDRKNFIAVASNVLFPDAIENANQNWIDNFLDKIFNKVKEEIASRNLEKSTKDLFLACTHFPLIKDQFLSKASEYDIDIMCLLDPNLGFSQLIFDIIKEKEIRNYDGEQIKIDVVSRTKLKSDEIRNLSSIISNESKEVAQALQNYSLNLDLF